MPNFPSLIQSRKRFRPYRFATTGSYRLERNNSQPFGLSRNLNRLLNHRAAKVRFGND
jgi:hypothetical protein